RGPSKTEFWAFLLLDKDLPEEKRKEAIYQAQHQFGPAGLWEQDDGENWANSTRGAAGTVAQRHPLNYSMNIGRGEVIDEEDSPPYIEATVTEHPQLWHYRSWAEWVAAESWADLRANHSRVPERL